MTAAVPKAQVGTLQAFSHGVQPVIEGGSEAFVMKALVNLRGTLDDLLLMTPQSAIADPPRLKDGMIRLARNPWWPVSGQTRDAWVYWDAAGQLWRALPVFPTTT